MRILGSEDCSKYPQVTSDKLFVKGGEPHPDGLFSTVIFGTSPRERSERFGSIHFNTELIHPEVWILLKRAFRKKLKAILELKPYTITDTGDIVIYEDDTVESTKGHQIFIGLPALISRLQELNLPDTISGNILKKIFNIAPFALKISCIIVIPPEYRKVIDEFTLDPLNQAYVNLIKYSKNLVSIPKDFSNETYARYVNLMQLQIEQIYEALSSKLGKKMGAIRMYLLGKRLDFTARGVIVGDPKIPIDTLGVPVRIAVKLFEPWLIRSLTLEHHFKTDEAVDIITRISMGFTKPGHIAYDTVKEALKEITKDRVVLAKRDPALHRLSWQAYRIQLVDDNAIHVNPLHTVGMNADFDGDTIISIISLDIGQNKYELTCHISDLERAVVVLDENELVRGVEFDDQELN